MVAAPAKIACITRIFRRRASAELISCQWWSMVVVIIYLCASLLAAGWVLVIDLLGPWRPDSLRLSHPKAVATPTALRRRAGPERRAAVVC